VGTPFWLAPKAQEIIDGLKAVLPAQIGLEDRRRGELHLAMAGRWFSTNKSVEPDAVGAHLRARINRRWTLTVGHPVRLPVEAQELAMWAARKLAPHMLDDETGAVDPTAGGGGGTSGAAELGIPVWWARKGRA
jgi:hypothetical protein